jgi:predicted 3-demethylubiquinone-9 3-methyltransferase (glyoxalase superfamily)
MTTNTQKIIPHLWYDKEAKEAARFYTSVFPDSRITFEATLHNTPSGDVDSVEFEIWGYKFMAISAGPLFQFNPSVSFMVNFDPSREKDAGKKIDAVWEKLSQGGKILMPLDKYPFSERYGWVQDKYGLSWQLLLANPEGEKRPVIVPSLLFTGDVCSKAEEAIKFYLSVFKNTREGNLHRYGPNQAPDKEGTVMYADFMLENQWMAAMDSAHDHKFGFNEAISFIVICDTQKEIDYYWEKLSAVPEAEQCGWLKDNFGLSWQVAPAIMNDMMNKGTRAEIDRVTQAFLKMKKFDIKKLEEAYGGKTEQVR